MCLTLYFKVKPKNFEHEYLNCNKGPINEILQEFLKRFYKPIYIPLIALMSSLLVIKAKENSSYRFYKNFLFIIVFFIIVISEISLRYVSDDSVGLWFFIIFPISLFFLIYFSLLTVLNKKI